MEELLSTGFPRDDITFALKKCSHNAEQAIEYLLSYSHEEIKLEVGVLLCFCNSFAVTS
jgi:hypothetical protein